MPAYTHTRGARQTRPPAQPLRQELIALQRWLCTVVLAVSLPAAASGIWRPLAHGAPEGVDLLLLQTDGSVLAHSVANYERWFRLTPTAAGSYPLGTWSTIAPMHHTRLYFASHVLTNGSVFVAGGEYGTGDRHAEVFNPLTGDWTKAPDQGSSFADAISEILPNGDILVAPVGPTTSGGTAIYSPGSNAWRAGPKTLHGGSQDEASWLKLADGSILTIDPFTTTTERYLPGQNRWVNDATTPVKLYSSLGELGPAFLLPSGNGLFLGGNGLTLIYTPTGTASAGRWAPGPTIPMGLGIADGSGAMMANGNILFEAGPAAAYAPPARFFEYNPFSNTLSSVTGPTGATLNVDPFEICMLDLPDGSVLVSQQGAALYVYQPAGAPLAAGRPTILTISTNLDGSYHLTGTLLNGISEGAAYGDDEQMASNYPLIQVTDAAGHVFYGRTFNIASTAVMTGSQVQNVDFAAPPGLLAGTNAIRVVANGNASQPFAWEFPDTPLPSVLGVTASSVTGTHFQIRWNTIGGNERGYRVERSGDGASYAAIASVSPTTSTYTDTHVSPLGRYYYRVIATNEAGDGGASAVCFGATPAASALPAPWSAQDLGFVFGPGTAGPAAGGGITAMGSGRSFDDPIDQCQFVSQTLTGDFLLTAHIGSLVGGASNAVAGLMIRRTLDANAADVVVGVHPDRTPVFSVRQLQDLAASPIPTTDFPGAVEWLRLERLGGVITASASPDGINWTALGSAAAPMLASVNAGMAITSGSEWRLAAVTFDHISLTVPPLFQVALQGGHPLTNECHTPFVDPGAVGQYLVSRLAAGSYFNVAGQRGGPVVPWGDDTHGEGAPPAAASKVSQVSGGLNHALALASNGRIFAWGDNTYGQLQAPTTLVWQAVAAGSYHNLALTRNGSVTQWGDQSRGQANVPTNLDTIVSIAAGGYHSLALSSAGKVTAWGSNNSGQTSVPDLPGGAVAIAAGGYHSLALTAQGAVIGWGNNSYRQTTTPANIGAVIALAAGQYHSLALRTDGTVAAWGNNTHGQTNVPPGLSNVVAISAGAYHSAALLADGTARVWGDDLFKQTSGTPAFTDGSLLVTTSGIVDANTPGRYELTYTANNGSGGTAISTRDVVVVDRAAPVITLRGANPLSVLFGTPFIDPGADASDACAGDVTAKIIRYGVVDTSVVGTNQITYSVTDSSGNTANFTRQVNVVATIPRPTLSIVLDSSGGVSITFPGIVGAQYSVYTTASLALPLNQWTPLGLPTNASIGLPALTVYPATTNATRFYRVDVQ